MISPSLGHELLPSPSKVPKKPPSPSTTVSHIDIAHPKSPASSTFTTPSVAPKSAHTATSASPASSLEYLHEDVLYRIASHLLTDSFRGTPHYPRKHSPDALSLAQTSTTLARAVARHFTSDNPWLHIIDDDVSINSLTPAFMQKVLAWYTLTAPYLTSLHLHSCLAYFPLLRTRVMYKLLDARPPLKFIDLSSFDKMADSPMYADLAELLNHTGNTITTVTTNLTPRLIHVLCNAPLSSVTTLHVKFGLDTNSESFINLLKSLTSDQTHLTQLTIRTIASLPHDLTSQSVFPLVHNIKHLEYHHGGMHNSIDSFKLTYIHLTTACKNLHTLSLHNCPLDLSDLNALLDKERHPFLNTLDIVKCTVSNMHSVLEAVSDRVSHLELTQDVDSVALQIIGRCKKVTHLGLTMSKVVVGRLGESLATLIELRSLSLSLHGGAQRVERELVEALERTRGKFEKFVLHGMTLRYEAIRHVMRTLGPQLQFWVTGIYTPRKSPTKIILQLLEDTARYNPNLKVLCFGLGLTYDRWGATLHQQLLDSIAIVGTTLRGLDTYWLTRNAKSILQMERPEDFVEYESEDSDAEGS